MEFVLVLRINTGLRFGIFILVYLGFESENEIMCFLIK